MIVPSLQQLIPAITGAASVAALRQRESWFGAAYRGWACVEVRHSWHPACHGEGGGDGGGGDRMV